MDDMREVTWTPEPGVLFDLSELDGPVAYTITAEVLDELGVPVPVLDYEVVSLTPPAPVLTVTASPHGVQVSAESLAGLFPIQYLDYLLGGVLHRVYSWDDLPAETEAIVAFMPSTKVQETFTLKVRAILEHDPLDAVEAEYTMTVRQDWTAGRNRLLEEINARSD